jgi:hypothetical protein
MQQSTGTTSCLVGLLQFLAIALLVLMQCSTCDGFTVRSGVKHVHRFGAVSSSTEEVLTESDVLVDGVSLGGGVARKLGGYERVLSREAPGDQGLSLSHGTAYVLSGSMDNDALTRAVGMCMQKHPILRVNIAKENGTDVFRYCPQPLSELANAVVNTVSVLDTDFENIWRDYLEKSLNKARFEPQYPLWKLFNIVSSTGSRSAWVFQVNHGIDDQQSTNMIVNDILAYRNSQSSGKTRNPLREIMTKALPFPASIEEAIGPAKGVNLATLAWSLYQLYNMVSGPAMVPARVRSLYDSDPNSHANFADPDSRETFVEAFRIDSSSTQRLRANCRKEGVTVTHALAAAMLALTSETIEGRFLNSNKVAKLEKPEDQTLRFLLSVGLRPFGLESQWKDTVQSRKDDFTGGTVACAAGAIDYLVNVPGSGLSSLYETDSKGAEPTAVAEPKAIESLWKLAKVSKSRAKLLIEILNFVPESVRLFGIGMGIVPILEAVEIEARNAKSMGRGFSCGVSNVGLLKFPEDQSRTGSKSALAVQGVYYATSHARTGVLCQLSSATVETSDGSQELCGTLQFTYPLVTVEEATAFRNAFIRVITHIATE